MSLWLKCLWIHNGHILLLQEQRKKLHENVAYFKGVPYPVCYITRANYYKYESLLISNIIYVLTDDETKQNWSLDK